MIESDRTKYFLLGLVMATAGLYLLLSNITVSGAFSLGYPLYRVPMGQYGFGLTSGALLIPFMAGVGLIFYNVKSLWGWALGGGALAAIIIGVLLSLSINMRSMSLLTLMVILVLGVGGLGLLARSLRK